MDPDRRLKADAQAALEADRRALNTLKAAMKPGRHVKWMHGSHERSGKVVEVIGFAFHHARVRVKSDASGKVFDVCKGSILDRL